MNRQILVIALLLCITSCSQKRQTDQERFAQQQAELEETKKRKEFWQNTATVLGCAVMLALAVGAVLGSKTKEASEK